MKWLTNMSKWEVRIFCCRFCRLSQPHRTSKDFFQNLWQTYFILTGLIPLHTAMCGESRGQAAPSKTVALTGGGGSGGGWAPDSPSRHLQSEPEKQHRCSCSLLMSPADDTADSEQQGESAQELPVKVPQYWQVPLWYRASQSSCDSGTNPKLIQSASTENESVLGLESTHVVQTFVSVLSTLKQYNLLKLVLCWS